MRYLFTTINTLMVAAIAYFCVGIIYKNIIPENLILSDKHVQESTPKNINPSRAKLNFNKNRYNNIMQRNIFKVAIAEKKNRDNQETENLEDKNLETTKLKLILWGTVAGISEVYAVIEDKKIRQQALYEVGDSIQGAKIKKILRHKVILTYQIKDQILEMETDDKNLQKSRTSTEKTDLSKSPASKSLIDTLSNNVNDLIKQVKFRPHFKGGEPDGLMIYGIRPNSIFRKFGLRNGDIIKEFNGTPITSAEDATRLFPEIKAADNARITPEQKPIILILESQLNQACRKPLKTGL